jgi:ribonucleoside-triphosphate reductase (thioredoxin)
MDLASKILSDIIVYTKYAKYREQDMRRETWEEIVDRRQQMDIDKFPQLADEIRQVYGVMRSKQGLGSMRAMQFGGEAISINNARGFNCAVTSFKNAHSFGEFAFLLLAGCGVGFSVQNRHINELPEIHIPTKTRRFLVSDSIEGWADAVKVLMNAYFTGKPRPNFDFRAIRPKGSRLKTSGGIAPGPQPLKDCLHNIQKILDRKQTGDKLRPIEVHDIACYIADCVLAGGIRRSATISLFDMDDEEMLSAKAGSWWELNPQRARANNSAVIVRHKVQKEDFLKFWELVKSSGSGEPGFLFTNDPDVLTNPCGEISLVLNCFCNLGEINASAVQTQEDLNKIARAVAFICTLQASYTDFHYLSSNWKRVTDKDALIGVSITGLSSWQINQFDLEQAARIVTEENARVAKLIGINTAARCTTVKPSGTASLVLGTSSGIHAWHSPFYIRRVRLEKSEPLYTYLAINHPELVQDDLYKPSTLALVEIPQKAPEGAITRHDETAIQLLERIKWVSEKWIAPGHRKGANHNNVSATVSVRPEEWAEVAEWMWENRNSYNALSVLPFDDHTYVQAPYEDTDEETYNRLMESIRSVDLTKVVELSDTTKLQEELACAGPLGCEITTV